MYNEQEVINFEYLLPILKNYLIVNLHNFLLLHLTTGLQSFCKTKSLWKLTFSYLEHTPG